MTRGYTTIDPTLILAAYVVILGMNDTSPPQNSIQKFPVLA